MTKTIKLAAVGLALLAMGSTAEARSFAASHPRRAEVNARLENQHDRIHAGVASGQLSPAEARTLRTDDRQIRGEERTMAKLDGGHITKADQRSLNQQENAVSQTIATDRHN